MQVPEIEKSNAHILADLVGYVPHSAVFRTLIKKITGNIIALAIDAGEKMEASISPFDTYIQIIEGKSEIIIDNHSNILETGQAILIPAHSTNYIRAKHPSKMIITVLKSGYEGIAI
jgi:quercetin dioxygenase-like cupin family protein